MTINVLRHQALEKEKLPLIGFADVQVDDLIIHNMKLINGKNGRFAQFPQRSYKDKWYDIVHPSTKSMRDAITAKLIESFDSK